MTLLIYIPTSPKPSNDDLKAMIKDLEHRFVSLELENRELKKRITENTISPIGKIIIQNEIKHLNGRIQALENKRISQLKESDQIERLKEQNRVLKETICKGISEGPKVKKKIAVTCSTHEPIRGAFGLMNHTCMNKHKCKSFWDNGKKPDFCPVKE